MILLRRFCFLLVVLPPPPPRLEPQQKLNKGKENNPKSEKRAVQFKVPILSYYFLFVHSMHIIADDILTFKSKMYRTHQSRYGEEKKDGHENSSKNRFMPLCYNVGRPLRYFAIETSLHERISRRQTP